MITKFLRRRNPNPANVFNNNFARIQVSGNTQTFNFKKTLSPAVGGYYLLTEASFNITTESGLKLTTG
jgi:hypothetical protein